MDAPVDVSANTIPTSGIFLNATYIDNFIGGLFSEIEHEPGSDSKMDVDSDTDTNINPNTNPNPATPTYATPASPPLSSQTEIDAPYNYVPSIIPNVPRQRITVRSPNTRRIPMTLPLPWAERKLVRPEPHFIRLFDDPIQNPYGLQSLWNTDYTLTEWHTMIEQRSKDLSDNVLINAFDVSGQIAFMKNVFAKNQRKRWLARVVQLKWTQRVWLKRTQCNVDMIDMAPIADADAILMTDTTHRQIFRFHRRDVFANLLSNICMSDEMLPTPREPTNPWNNSLLTMAQTMGICRQLVQDFAKRGKCPPVLFSAFWAARFSLRRFQDENSALLSQHAIAAYFKDLHPDNIGVVEDTIINLLTSTGLDYSPSAIRRWIHQMPQTALHKEWLTMVRDYTLYINLHVQARPSWHSTERIYVDVARLYNRMVLPEPLSNRVRALRTATTATTSLHQNPAILGLSMLFPNSLLDISGSGFSSGSATMSQEAAIQLIQNALFRY